MSLHKHLYINKNIKTNSNTNKINSYYLYCHYDKIHLKY